MARALYDFFYWVSGSDDVAEIITIFIILSAICFIILFPLLYPVFRNTYFIDKMSRKEKKRNRKNQDDFQKQLRTILADRAREEETAAYRKKIEELKSEIERLKKQKA